MYTFTQKSAVCLLFLQGTDKKFGGGFGTYGLAYHANLYHNEEFHKLPMAKMLKFPAMKNSPKFEPKSVWDFYRRCSENTNYVICNFCDKILSLGENVKFGSASGPYGLRYHAQNIHPEEFSKFKNKKYFFTKKKKSSAITEFYVTMTKKNAKSCWNFYKPCMESIYKAICNFCDRKLSLGYKKFGNGPGNFFLI